MDEILPTHDFTDPNGKLNRLWKSMPREIIRVVRTFLRFASKTRGELLSAVDAWCDDREWAEMKFWHISLWDVSQITDMSYLFDWKDMEHMFRCAWKFNQDIGGWDVRNVTNMEGMFCCASIFNQDIGGWDVRNVTNMERMFSYARAFNQETNLGFM